ncbi:hypothetical protein JCM10908_001719 [Rhodotorula pacifica]|uniref:uncharacterized protein n=1 Tax=Rhodotorula pacifica TaxID=1495444 RepID=UPI00316C3158
MLKRTAIPPSLAAWLPTSRTQLQQLVVGSSSPRRPFSTTRRSAQSARSYYYDVDIHGQLFLSEAKHRNVATAYRDPRFLDTFFTRMRRNDQDQHGAEAREARERGYEFVSECMGEVNFVRPEQEGTVLVFQALDGTDLRYAGSLSMPFDPASLRVDPSTGYLFHPSPVTQRTKRSHTSPYSLIRSSLVLEHLASSLELDSGSERGGGGTYEFAGKRFRIEPLQEGDVWRRRAG